MFERRLKIFLGLLCAVTFVLTVRAAQLQVVQKERWRKAAAETRKRSQLVETVRGSILDYQGRVLARDEACIDACVDYRALTDPPDENWVRDQAVARLKQRDEYLKASRSRRTALVAEETARVRDDLGRMWAKLAAVGHLTPEQVNDVRQSVVQRVEMRRMLVWYRNYRDAMAKASEGHESFWQKWLAEQSPDAKPLEKFTVVIYEQHEPHVVLHAVDPDTQIDLGKHIDRYPGLVLRPSTHRYYPYGPSACHLMGRVSHVNREDLDNDPEKDNEVRQYLPNDEIGRGGVEGLCERVLRGTKGKIVRLVGEEGVLGHSDPVPGRDVKLTLDIDLQAQVEDAFAHAELIDTDGSVEKTVLHGAAVVIDVPTGEVRALVSYPTYDPNAFDELYDKLYHDQMNKPLMNRATMAQLQPGSTVKPMVGLSAITQGLATPNEGVECTGYLVIDGVKQSSGRCWVASKFSTLLNGAVAHHPVPWSAPHPTGFLTFGDALERSCNVYFETMAHRLGPGGLSVWFSRFGLGRQTGLGIPEARGRLPRDFKGTPEQRLSKTWFAGIGQDPVAATPIQMANVAATIARDGVWVRPRLIPDDEARRTGVVTPPPTTRPGEPPAALLDRVDLHLSPDALAAAKDGMWRVVNGKAGTGKQILVGSQKLARIPICGKTGTAQVGRFAIHQVDPRTGQPLVDERGKPLWEYPEPSTKEHPNPKALWYRGNGADGKDLNHAWYIGFAPADRPQVAFAVMVEYGGSGGAVAGSVARKTLEACVDQGYLK